MKSARKLIAVALGAAALFTATPASAGWAVIYYSDYIGGTQVGAAVQNDCGAIIYEWGQRTDVYEYGWVTTGC
jgi:hypothetical protein